MTGGPDRVQSPNVEPQPVAEILPVLYRGVLDAIGDLEARGLRREAAHIRVDAIEAYSGAWNEAAARRLASLRSRAEKVRQGRHPDRRPVAIDSLDAGADLDLERTTV